MLEALRKEGFHVRIHTSESFEGNIRRIRLLQIFFVNDEQVIRTQCFCSDFMIQLDSTFNTNDLKLPLAYMVGVDNHGKSFTAVLSFICSENATDINFLLNCLDELIFYGDDCPRPKVIITDQALGIHKALRDHTMGWS